MPGSEHPTWVIALSPGGWPLGFALGATFTDDWPVLGQFQSPLAIDPNLDAHTVAFLWLASGAGQQWLHQTPEGRYFGSLIQLFALAQVEYEQANAKEQPCGEAIPAATQDAPVPAA